MLPSSSYLFARHVVCSWLTSRFGTISGCVPCKSQSKPGTKMVNPEPCKELERRTSATISGWDYPFLPFVYRVLIVAHVVSCCLTTNFRARNGLSRPGWPRLAKLSAAASKRAEHSLPRCN